ncbi:LppU/SCO3897 family protein [Actinacidiphila paucisporea]|uniref:Protein kinase domain-containing protein n=1 Tax=Actinacidiphila paucisporea TaxID=310782 RepID=A0A1M7HVC4_9ACTN|nr:hypothetical protein [Actinacidiphila paucisporea]SHM32456.1 hypothetical protein SAMN05216499_11059 [Actinacidiphila paucisporea]
MEPLTAGDPAQVGPYQLVGRLGASELGQAYAGRHPGGATVTVTLLHPRLAADSRARARFRRDVDDARRVAGPYVLPVDADTESAAPWLASPGPDATTLAGGVAGSGPLPAHLLRDLAVALTGALAGAQAAGVLLTGLDPSAVIMAPEGPRLAPFGIAHVVRGAGPDPDAVHTVGAVLHFAATGRPPGAWQGPLPVGDPVLARLITDCLAARPAARPTVHDLAARLGTAPPGTVPPGAAPPLAMPPGAAPPLAMPPGAAPPLAPPPLAVPPLAAPAPRPWWREIPASVLATAVGLAVIAALVLTAGSSHDDSLATHPPAGATATGIPGLSDLPGDLPGDLPADEGATPGDDGNGPSDAAPSDSPTPEDPIATAQTGDCFTGTGTARSAELAPAACRPQTFKVVQVLHATTDTHGCDSVPQDSWNVSYPAQDLVLCLSYQYENGTAYHAVAGDCVYGTTATSDWDELACQDGAFTVQKRITGTTDGSRCKGLRNNDWAEHFGVSGRSDLDVTLCLSMIYPDDAGHAVLNQCMHFSGTATQPSLHAAACAKANVIVTGRTPKYNDGTFCGNDAWTTWKPDHYPQLAYTLCYRRR